MTPVASDTPKRTRPGRTPSADSTSSATSTVVSANGSGSGKGRASRSTTTNSATPTKERASRAKSQSKESKEKSKVEEEEAEEEVVAGGAEGLSGGQAELLAAIGRLVQQQNDRLYTRLERERKEREERQRATVDKALEAIPALVEAQLKEHLRANVSAALGEGLLKEVEQ